MENWSFRSADFISVPIAGAVPAYHPGLHSKIRVIPQGFKFKELSSIELCEDKISPCFAYSGNFIFGFRDPRSLLEYLLGLKLDYRFYIFTKHGEMIRSYVEKSNGRIIIKDYVPRDTLISYLKSVDFLINIDNNTDLQSPSKLIDYIQTGRPVLNIESELDTVKIDAFLKGDYSKGMELPDLAYYRIENVARKFMDLKLEN